MPLILYNSNFRNMIECSIVSKAFDKSNSTQMLFFLFSMFFNKVPTV